MYRILSNEEISQLRRSAVNTRSAVAFALGIVLTVGAQLSADTKLLPQDAAVTQIPYDELPAQSLKLSESLVLMR